MFAVLLLLMSGESSIQHTEHRVDVIEFNIVRPPKTVEPNNEWEGDQLLFWRWRKCRRLRKNGGEYSEWDHDLCRVIVIAHPGKDPTPWTMRYNPQTRLWSLRMQVDGKALHVKSSSYRVTKTSFDPDVDERHFRKEMGNGHRSGF